MPPVRTRDFGWHPDVADHRDHLPEHQHAVRLMSKLKMRRHNRSDLPDEVDWREYCGPAEDQEELATGPAHACVALVQQFERRASGRLLRLSRLFAHQSACRMSNAPCNSGVSLRTVWKAIVRCGVPPEQHWPYGDLNLSRDPDPFAYSFQREFRALRYMRLDGPAMTSDLILNTLRSFLAAGFCFAFGFPVCTSIGDDADIPFPTAADDIVGGQAVTAVGYDDKRRIRSDKGALLVRNSWGANWGERGFGWLPYAYVKRRLALDFWTLLRPSWLTSGEFELPQ